jgi:glycosyltransferase involved in cell wall biosynthesis
MDREPKISVIVPVYQMENWMELTKRNILSILKQNYKEFEIIVSDDSDDDQLKIFVEPYPIRYFKNPGTKGMANNSNYGIDQATGEIVKILYQDDYLFNQSSLREIAKHFTPTTQWLVTGCIHTLDGKRYLNPHEPFYSESDNTIGSPSVLAFRKYIEERFDPNFHWVLDLDLYKRLFRRYGLPKILKDVNVVIGIHQGQMTNKLTDQRKQFEHQSLKEKHA